MIVSQLQMFGVVVKEETSGWLSSRKLVAPKRDNIHLMHADPPIGAIAFIF